jgi:hypothetical protein
VRAGAWALASGWVGTKGQRCRKVAASADLKALLGIPRQPPPATAPLGGSPVWRQPSPRCANAPLPFRTSSTPPKTAERKAGLRPERICRNPPVRAPAMMALKGSSWCGASWGAGRGEGGRGVCGWGRTCVCVCAKSGCAGSGSGGDEEAPLHLCNRAPVTTGVCMALGQLPAGAGSVERERTTGGARQPPPARPGPGPGPGQPQPQLPAHKVLNMGVRACDGRMHPFPPPRPCPSNQPPLPRRCSPLAPRRAPFAERTCRSSQRPRT